MGGPSLEELQWLEGPGSFLRQTPNPPSSGQPKGRFAPFGLPLMSNDGRPLTRIEAWRQLAMFAGHWVLRGYGLWAVEERVSGEFLGRIGCLNPEGFPAFEIAYTLGQWAWGKGYAREGAAAALRYARETLGRTEITSIIRPANAASIRVASSLGAVAGESVEFFGAPSVIYRYQRL